jgi:hypothetical protein
MIQRIQSLWLLLAAVCAFLTLKFSFYTGNILVNDQPALRNLTGIGLAGDAADVKTDINFISLLLVAATGIIALIAVFMFADRKTQFRLSIVALIASVLAVVYLFIRTNDFISGTTSLTSVFALLPPVFLFLAARGIRGDEKLVRSMDRLR